MANSKRKRIFKRSSRRTERQGKKPGFRVTNQNIKESIYELGQAVTQIGHVVGVLVELAGKDAVQAKAEEITARIAAEQAEKNVSPTLAEPSALDLEIAAHNAAVDAG